MSTQAARKSKSSAAPKGNPDVSSPNIMTQLQSCDGIMIKTKVNIASFANNKKVTVKQLDGKPKVMKQIDKSKAKTKAMSIAKTQERKAQSAKNEPVVINVKAIKTTKTTATTDMTKCECCFDSQMAYVVIDKNDTKSPKVPVMICDYLADEQLQADIKSRAKFLMCADNNELVPYESDIRKSHFMHLNSNPNPTDMSEWHQNWQKRFKNTEITIGKRRADAVVKNIVIEFQHSRISKEQVDKRNESYKQYGKKVYWVLDCNSTVKVSEGWPVPEIQTLTFSALWQYESFLDCSSIFLNIGQDIYKINPKQVKAAKIDVPESKTVDEFVNSFDQSTSTWGENDTEQYTLYHNQMGAGCGKTYDSIQLLNSNDKFRSKNVYIYLTKAHSAKEVIYNELKDQYDRGELRDIKVDTENGQFGLIGRQYKISFKNNKTNEDGYVIIGTIDSFMHALSDKTSESSDYFKELVLSIERGKMEISKKGNIRYASKQVTLNKNCLIVIDEAQDLDPEYIRAMCQIMEQTSIDTYVIGDKLQSIYTEENIYTYLEQRKIQAPNMRYVKGDGINHVRRFHNEKFKDFVNDIVKFEKYGLPEIEKVCDDANCRYEHSDETPYILFEMPSLNQLQFAMFKSALDAAIEYIIERVDIERRQHNYLPKNFMFIFPTVSKNYFGNVLESRLQKYWIDQIDNEDYREGVLKKDPYWKDHIDDSVKYVFFHKSVDGRSINLRESEHATRILSIHAAKGNGCEVVFLFGMTESTLSLWGGKDSLIYESLLHVAITRQKRKLYIGLVTNGDDIHKRFEKIEIQEGIPIHENIKHIKKTIHIDKITEFSASHDSFCKVIDKKYYDKVKDSLPSTDVKEEIIDFGHHMVRGNLFSFYIMYNIINDHKIDTINDQKINADGTSSDAFDRDQFKTIMRQTKDARIELLQHKEYYGQLNKNAEYSKRASEEFARSGSKKIPVLIFNSIYRIKYGRYPVILKKMMRRIQIKIREQPNEMVPKLCPLECVIYLHMIEVYDGGKFGIPVMMVYDLMMSYDKCSDSNDDDHKAFGCICSEHFKEVHEKNDKNQSILKEIKKHYDKIEHIGHICKNLKEYMKENTQDLSEFKFNINHHIEYNGENAKFKIHNNTIGHIASSDKYVIYFILVPQFNKLNIRDILFDSVFNSFVIKNIKKDNDDNEETKNYQRYHSKKILTCILTLDSEDPVFWEHAIELKDTDIMQCLKAGVIHYYSSRHLDVYNFYKSCTQNRPKGKSSLTHAVDELAKESHEKVPSYIREHFLRKIFLEEYDSPDEGIATQLIKNTESLNDPKIFIDELNKALEKAVGSYIGI